MHNNKLIYQNAYDTKASKKKGYKPTCEDDQENERANTRALEALTQPEPSQYELKREGRQNRQQQDQRSENREDREARRFKTRSVRTSLPAQQQQQNAGHEAERSNTR